MNKETNDFKIGLFVLVGALLLVTAVLAFGGTRFFEKYFLAETYIAENVTGLDVGAAVTLRGVRVGKVTKIDFSWTQHPQATPGYVHIEFQILARTFPGLSPKEVTQLLQTRVEQGLRARVETQGLVGATLLSLEYLDPAQNPPPPIPWTPRHIYIPSAPSQINKLLTSVEESMRKLSKIDFEQLNASLNKDLQGVDHLIQHIDGIDFNRIGTNTDALLTQWQNISTNLGSLLTEVRGTLQGLRLEQTSERANGLMVQLEKTLRRLDATLARVDVGSFNETIESLRQTSSQLDGTLHELKQYPSGFFFGSPPPPAKSIQTPGR